MLPKLGKLHDVPIRESFPDEARNMTPWLAENIEYISDVIGLPLELDGTEVRVERFAADIIAIDVSQDRKVLIENQLEISDHTHLGQIMTYLAGLDAKVMVWIASDFREPHLAAIRWLNDNTVEPFAFFAIKLRLLSIDGSLNAPLFEVIEKPNNWERNLKQQTIKQNELSELGLMRQAFWQHLNDRHPELATSVMATSSIWLEVEGGLNLVIYKATGEVGIFLRGARGENVDQVLYSIRSDQDAIAQLTGNDITDFNFKERFVINTTNTENWDEATDWIAARLPVWKNAFKKIYGNQQEAAE